MKAILQFLLTFLALEQVCNFSLPAVAKSNRRLVMLHSENAERSPEVAPGHGEWPEWDQEASLDEELYSYDEDNNSSANLSSGFMMEISTINAGRALVGNLTSKIRDNINNSDLQKSTTLPKSSSSIDPGDVPRRSSSLSDWKGWSEEPPYFDEDDVQDDEGNWGRKDKSDSDTVLIPSTSSFSSSTVQSSSSSEWDRFTGSGSSLKMEVVSQAPTKTSPAQDSTTITSLITRIDLLEKKLATIQQSQSLNVPQRGSAEPSMGLTVQLAFLGAFLTFQIILISKL